MLKMILIIIVNILIIGYVYIRTTFQFWAIQPVFHLYDIHHWINTDKIINPQLPIINKYVNFKHINTINNKNMHQDLRKECASFIFNNYLRSKTVNYSPGEKEIFSYLSCSIGNAFVTMYRDDTKNLIGVITARPIFITFSNKSPLLVNYIDNLTVRKDKRKLGIAPELIQTHHYNIRHLDTSVKVCLFKREGDMTAIVPLTTYETKGYNVSDICNIKTLCNNKYSVKKINYKNCLYFKNIIKDAMHKFDCTINIEMSTLVELILSSKIIIYILFEDKIPKCCYILRKVTCSVEYNIKCMDLIGSINMSSSTDIFFTGFKIVCKRIIDKYNIGRILMETTSDTNMLMHDISKHNVELKSKCPTAFFLYNYAHYSIKPEKCFFVY